MVLKTSAGAPITCTDWDNLCDEDGFLGLGRNRYHCEYVIYTDGTYYYAENGATGNLDYGGPNNRGATSGTDCAAVIQAAHDALTAGGTIAIKGSHTVNSSITVTNPVKFMGNKMGVPGVGAGTALTRSTDSPIFVINENYVGFHDMMLVGNATHTSALISTTGSPASAVFKRIWLQANGGRGIDTGTGYWFLFEKIRATNLADYPIYSSSGPGIVIRGLSALSCAGLVYIAGGRAHIVEDIEADTFDAGTVLISLVNAHASLRAINLEGHAVNPFQSRAIEISNCTFSIDDTRLWYLGENAPNLNPIYIHSNSRGKISSLMTENTYSPNSIEFGVNIYIEFEPTANNLDVAANGLYENEGTAVIANGTNSIPVAHGLMATPTNIRVTGTHAEVEACYVSTIGAANFTVHKGGAGNVTANRDVFWRAAMR